MKKVFRICALSFGLVATFLVLTESDSQDTSGGARGTSAVRERQGRGRFDPAAMMERQIERFKERLGFSEEEWTAVKPLVQSVIEKQREARFSPFMGGPGPMGGSPPEGFGPPGAPPNGPPTSEAEGRDRGASRVGGGDRGERPDRNRGSFFGPPSPEVVALQEALDKEETPEADLQAKLKDLRVARKKQEDDLKTARENLRELLTVRQEAMSVLMGLLD